MIRLTFFQSDYNPLLTGYQSRRGEDYTLKDLKSMEQYENYWLRNYPVLGEIRVFKNKKHDQIGVVSLVDNPGIKWSMPKILEIAKRSKDYQSFYNNLLQLNTSNPRIIMSHFVKSNIR